MWPYNGFAPESEEAIAVIRYKYLSALKNIYI